MTRSTSLTAAITLLSFSLLWACGSDESTSSNNKQDWSMSEDTTDMDTAPTITADEFVAQMYAKYNKFSCDFAYDCPKRAYFSLLQTGKYPTREACIASFKRIEFVWAQLLPGVNPDRLKFDPLKATECLAAYDQELQGLLCTKSENELRSPNPTAPECDQVFQSLVPLNGDCTTDFECTENNCNVPKGTCSGKCLAAGTTPCGGVTCTAQEKCYSPEDGTPECLPVAKLGEECERRRGFEPCEEDTRCTVSKDSTDRFRGLCVANYSVKEREPCTSNRTCTRGLRCDFQSSTCVKADPFSVVALDQECLLLQGFEPGVLCASGLTCQELTQVENENRRIFFDEKGVCKAPSSENASCKNPFECESSFYCSGSASFTEGVCTKKKADGEACLIPSECSSKNCIRGFCTQPAQCIQTQ